MAGNIANNFGSFPVVFKEGKGSTLVDVNNKKYIDFVAGIGVNALGHQNPALVKAIVDQANKQIHVSNYYTSDKGLEYADLILKATNMDKVYFCNSGAEANEAAIKLARKYGWLKAGGKDKKPGTKARNVIITLEKSFHGRSLATLMATGQDVFHPDCFAPYPEGFKTIPANDFDVLKTAFDDSVCALMIECVQGEGGVNLIDKKWAQAAAKAARDAGAIVIADEVQTGMGRTGTLFASQDLGFDPEVITTAKGIAGGLPMGACFYKGAADVFVSGDHQSTFAGNPMVCAAAIATLKELTKPGFFDSVKEKGEYIRNTIKSWNLPCIKEVRGKGLMIGIDTSLVPIDVKKKCLDANPIGLCVSTAGTITVRFLPPLVITKEEIDTGLEIFKKVMSE